MTKQISMTILSCAVCLALGVQAQEVVLSTDSASAEDDCALMVQSGSTIEFTSGGVKIEVGDNPNACLDDKATGGGGSVTLDAQPGTVQSGDDVTVSWSVPDSPFTCALTKTGAGTIQTNTQIRGNAANQIVDQNVTASATYQMSCNSTKTNGTESASATSKITVEGGGDGGGGGGGGTEVICDEQISGLNRTSTVDIVVNNSTNKKASTYEEVWGPWGASSSTIYFKLKTGQYASLPFQISENASGFAELIWDQLHGNPSAVRVSVSQCVGPPVQSSALPQSTEDSCYHQGIGTSGGFRMKTNNTQYGECVLQRGVQYYLNVAFINADGSNACSEPGGTCIWNVTEF